MHWRKVGHMLTIGNFYWWGLDGQSYDHLYQKDHCQSFGFWWHYQKSYGDVNSMSPNLLINYQIRPLIENLKSVIHWLFPYCEVSPPWVKIMAPPLAMPTSKCGQGIGLSPRYIGVKISFIFLPKSTKCNEG